MRTANLSGRAVLLGTDLALDIENASAGLFDSSPLGVYQRWSEFGTWAESITVDGHALARRFAAADLGTPVPRPAQIFAIGLNYAAHGAETNLGTPKDPIIFTKFVSSLTGPEAYVRLSGDTVDWEAELVVVIGAGGRSIAEADVWNHIAGFTVGQDLSDRTVQMWGPPAQFSLGKSFEGFAPVGPFVVSVDEIAASHDRDDLRISCSLQNGEGGTIRVLQDDSTASMIFSVPEIIARLSGIVELLPGDLVFTGTPAGVGMGRNPAEYLHAGQILTTRIEGIGTIRQKFID